MKLNCTCRVGKPQPLPLQPLMQILQACYTETFAGSRLPQVNLEQSALYLLQLGQEHLLLLQKFMSELPTMAKATAPPLAPFPGSALERFFKNPIEETAQQIGSFHPMAAALHPLPDLRNYFTNTTTTQDVNSHRSDPHFDQRYPEDNKRIRFQRPPSGPPGAGRPGRRHSSHPFISTKSLLGLSGWLCFQKLDLRIRCGVQTTLIKFIR